MKADAKRVPKTGKNQHFGYQFATESDISDCLRDLMNEHGVCLLYHGPKPDQILVEEAGTTKSGAIKLRCRVWMRYELVNVDNPAEREEVWGYGEALDMEDKGHNKAITNCHKYVMMKVFDISTGDPAEDPDREGHADTVVRPPPAAPRQTRPPAVATSAASTPAGGPGAEGEAMGLDGAAQLLGRMNDRGITLKEIRAGLYKRGLKDVLKGREVHPQLWPAGMIDDIKAVLTQYKVLEPTTDDMELLRRAAVRAWNKQSTSYKPGDPIPSDPSFCKDPGELMNKMFEGGEWDSIKDESAKIKQMVRDLDGDLLDVLSGTMIPF